MFKFFPFLLLLLIFSFSAGCQQQQPEPPLVQVGSREIQLEQFRAEAGPALVGAGDQSSAEQQMLQRRLLAQMIDRELILIEAEKLGVEISPEEMETALVELRGAYQAEEFQTILRESGQNPEQWLRQLKLRLLTEKVAELATAAAAVVSDEEIKTYYEKNLEEFRRPAQLKARQIMVSTEEEAQQALSRLKLGEDFADLAREISLSPDHENGGDLGYFARNQLPSEFDEVLFKLPVGRVSQPVASPYGYHLFLVEEKRKAGLESFASARPKLAERLHRERKEAAFAEWLKNLRQKTPVYIDWTQLQSED